MGNLYPLTPSLKPLLCKAISRGPLVGGGGDTKTNQKKKNTSTASRLTLKASCASSSYSEVVGGVRLIVITDRGLVGLTVSNFFLLQDSVPPR